MSVTVDGIVILSMALPLKAELPIEVKPSDNSTVFNFVQPLNALH